MASQLTNHFVPVDLNKWYTSGYVRHLAADGKARRIEKTVVDDTIVINATAGSETRLTSKAAIGKKSGQFM